MLHTFKSDATADVIMYAEHASRLLKIIGKDNQMDKGIVTVELARDEIVLCAPPEHRPATGPSVQLRDYAQLPWIVDSDGSAFEQFVLSVCRAAGFEPRVVAHCSNLLAILQNSPKARQKNHGEHKNRRFNINA